MSSDGYTNIGARKVKIGLEVNNPDDGQLNSVLVTRRGKEGGEGASKILSFLVKARQDSAEPITMLDRLLACLIPMVWETYRAEDKAGT